MSEELNRPWLGLAWTSDMLNGSMNIFDILIIQPIFNVIMVIYSLVPGHDLGVTLILFGILVRVALHKLIKKQLYQTKLMRQMRPELLKIKQKAKGNRQLEATMTMELYRERGANPFLPLGVVILQIPIFAALFGFVTVITKGGGEIARFTYDFLEGVLPGIPEAIAGNLNHTMFGLVDLTAKGSQPGGELYWPLLVIAAISSVLIYVQSKQLMPKAKDGRKLRDMLKDQAAGKPVDQAEISEAMIGRMAWLFPVLAFMFSIYFYGAMVLYFAATSAAAIFQQAMILKQDEEELLKLSDKTKTKVAAAKKAEVVSGTSKKGGESRKKRRK